MAKTTYKCHKGEFITAHGDLREVQFYAKVDAHDTKTADTGTGVSIEVGDLVKFNSSGDLVLVTTTGSAAPTLTGAYLVAQSDQTMNYGHVPVENRDYRYSPSVADTTSEKRVSLFAVVDWDDVKLTQHKSFDVTTT